MAGRPGELRHILGLAGPVIVGELGWMVMGVVDTMMVGARGPTAIAAVSIGNTAFDPLAMAASGCLLGLDTVVSQAFGAGKTRECQRWLWQGLYLGALVSLPMMGLMILATHAMRLVGVNPVVLDPATPYVHALAWSLPPLLAYTALRRYLQAMSLVWPVMFALVSANLVNALGNWMLLERYGVAGIGWSTCVARIYMALVLAVVALRRTPELRRGIPGFEPERVRALVRLGVPAGMQILLEIGVFATATVLVGRLAPQALAAHHICLNIAATMWTVPLGISSAGAVAVGQAIGRADRVAARRAGWLALGLAGGFTLATAALLSGAPAWLIRLFTTDGGVLQVGIPLMFVAAMWQMADGTQTVATGVLRGVGNTRTPMLANLVAHWLVGLPAGYVLCFWFGLGVTGLWLGLSLGLTGVAVLLVVAWWRTAV